MCPAASAGCLDTEEYEKGRRKEKGERVHSPQEIMYLLYLF